MKLNTDEARSSYEKLDEVEEEEVEVEPMSKIRVILMNMTQFGVNFMVLLLCVEVIPAQVEALVGSAAKGTCFGGMVAGGAVVTFFTSPVFGMISDRLRLKMGRRRPVMIVGTIFLCIGLTGMALSCGQVIV
ncbi:uncharacterized protein LOC121378792 [Gigantopelta aegis]|uniref:uncharacterized protein LOC121378792 n=1 Tax=Gigantopelta aegis TaxID=1735272 RepID=UPI001B888663|nr:uncharacterized protein LOC121378792 [Gigantopelta aegis]XP_041363046.1 uncharacterized protein LOC121378792 [Gigantopelta aegis]XP_041363047.1 uncharacterized protein LOC121378792 [Gigantopelta aegis]XP_041363048.1 uncharacterized protein LOC121378792 [Gigantopelta aegis]XP_041363049.1 uncharacterized protein LOC121378792 [Gigantopelta aegis]